MPMLSSRRARTPSRGSLTAPGPSLGTKRSLRRDTRVVPSGDDGEGTARQRSEGSPERYHRRSRVESKMNCVKLPGQSLMARDFDRQVAEIRVRVAVLNHHIAPGIPVTEAVG